jgi:hypothetical protein
LLHSALLELHCSFSSHEPALHRAQLNCNSLKAPAR